MEIVKRTNVIYEFSPDNEPVISVNPGTTILVETNDCLGGQLRDENDSVTSVDFSKINPATGPIELKGAMPGDILAVEILDIELAAQGFMAAIPGEGAFDFIKEPATKIIPVSQGKVMFTPSLSFPVHPMIGVIGVSPRDRSVVCGEIGDHGGNMDAKVICNGARVYFLVRKEGAMLALGDVHAAMGDGESLLCGVEINAKVKLKLDLIKSPSILPQRPVLELGDKFMTIAHGETLDQAASTALHDMADLIWQKNKMELTEIAMLISAVGDLKVCQIVNPQKTARVEMPKSILDFPNRPILP